MKTNIGGMHFVINGMKCCIDNMNCFVSSLSMKQFIDVMKSFSLSVPRQNLNQSRKSSPYKFKDSHLLFFEDDARVAGITFLHSLKVYIRTVFIKRDLSVTLTYTKNLRAFSPKTACEQRYFCTSSLCECIKEKLQQLTSCIAKAV